MIFKKFHIEVAMAMFMIIFMTILPNPSLAQQSGFTIDAPTSVDLPNTVWNFAAQQTIIDFAAAVAVSSAASTTTGFTAQVTSTELLKDGDPSKFMGYTALAVKTGNITTSQPDGVTAPLDGTYTVFTGISSTSDALNFMSADARNRNAGSWSITPSLRLIIPAKQDLGTYHATITFSLI